MTGSASATIAYTSATKVLNESVLFDLAQTTSSYNAILDINPLFRTAPKLFGGTP
jgi:hypothetical protein